MMQTRGRTARLRRTFHYPDDSDSDSDAQPEAIDEQEQEDLIANLVAENAARNNRFRTYLLVLPFVAALPYVPLLFGRRTAMLSMLAMSSLAATAFLLVRMPPHVTGIPLLDNWARGGNDLPLQHVGGHRRRRRQIPRSAAFGLLQETGSPLDLYLPYMNAGLAIVLVLMGLLTGRGAGAFGWVGVGNLPAIVYIAVLMSKMVMAGVDPERELSTLKYGYKGA